MEDILKFCFHLWEHPNDPIYFAELYRLLEEQEGSRGLPVIRSSLEAVIDVPERLQEVFGNSELKIELKRGIFLTPREVHINDLIFDYQTKELTETEKATLISSTETISTEEDVSGHVVSELLNYAKEIIKTKGVNNLYYWKDEGIIISLKDESVYDTEKVSIDLNYFSRSYQVNIDRSDDSGLKVLFFEVKDSKTGYINNLYYQGEPRFDWKSKLKGYLDDFF